MFVGKRSIKEILEYIHMEESEKMKHGRAQTLILGNYMEDAGAASERCVPAQCGDLRLLGTATRRNLDQVTQAAPGPKLQYIRNEW